MASFPPGSSTLPREITSAWEADCTHRSRDQTQQQEIKYCPRQQFIPHFMCSVHGDLQRGWEKEDTLYGPQSHSQSHQAKVPPSQSCGGLLCLPPSPAGSLGPLPRAQAVPTLSPPPGSAHTADLGPFGLVDASAHQPQTPSKPPSESPTRRGKSPRALHPLLHTLPPVVLT